MFGEEGRRKEGERVPAYLGGGWGVAVLFSSLPPFFPPYCRSRFPIPFPTIPTILDLPHTRSEKKEGGRHLFPATPLPSVDFLDRKRRREELLGWFLVFLCSVFPGWTDMQLCLPSHPFGLAALLDSGRELPGGDLPTFLLILPTLLLI